MWPLFLPEQLLAWDLSQTYAVYRRLKMVGCQYNGRNLIVNDRTAYSAAPGSHPLNSTGYALNSTHIFLDWSPPSLQDVNGIIREYRVNCTEGETNILRQHTTSNSTTEITVGPLHLSTSTTAPFWPSLWKVVLTLPSSPSGQRKQVL